MSDLAIDTVRLPESPCLESSAENCPLSPATTAANKALDELSASLDSPPSLSPERVAQDCDLIGASLKSVLAYEAAISRKLQAQEAQTNELLATTNLLLDLSKEITALPSSDKVQLSAEMQSILNELKEKGIDLLAKDPKEISKEQLIELKSAIGSRIDKSRTQIQQIFTKMQTLIQFMMSVNDSGKRILSEFTQLIRTIIKNMRP